MGKAPVVNDNYLRVIEDVRNDIHRSLTQNNSNDAPIVLRLAFHDAVNYDAATNKGGANGSVRLTQELSRNPNKGIENGVKFNEPIKQRHPEISYADLYQLAAIVAVEVTGGPAIEFIPGRADTDVPDQDNIPNPREGADHLRTVFYKTGLDDKDIVVLTGAHALGGAHKDRSGFDGNFTQNPLKFDNSYYIELLKGDTPGLVKFPTDKALLNDPRFRPFVELYAKDQAAFFRDYAKSHKKLSELGFHAQEANVHETKSHNAPLNVNHAQPCPVGN